MARILVAEDDRSANKLIGAVLRKDGHVVLSAADGQEALDTLDHEYVDLIVSDVMMPRVDGLELTRQLREAGWDVPILILTARTDAETLHAEFLQGADDYLTKPADMKELVLRVRALLRRSGTADTNRIIVGKTVLDGKLLTVERPGERVELPPKEFQLLFKLLSNPGRAYTRMQLLDEVWGWDTDSSEATVNVHVNRLRTRFSAWDDFHIRTIRGIGYCGEVAKCDHEGHLKGCPGNQRKDGQGNSHGNNE